MKRILIALALAAATSLAVAGGPVGSYARGGGVLATMPNQGGGQIELTNLACPRGQPGWIAHSYTINGQSDDSYGCWTSGMGGQTTTITWVEGNGYSHTRTYETNSFNATEYGLQDSSWKTVY